ncbi:MAG: hypothetical protein GX933_06750 [Chloroflexi bacterium]|nr:hypothetical protein [Chloroflexota bacterium]
MIRKKLMVVFVLFLLVLSICSFDQVNFKSMDAYTANSMDKLVNKAGENVFMAGHSKTSEYEVDYTYTVGLDENGERFFIYTDSNGYEEIVEGGRGYGYDPDSGKLFLIAYIGDAYESEMNDLWNSFPIVKTGDYENDDQYITDIEQEGNNITVSYDFPDETDEAEEGSRAFTTFVADAETLFFESGKTVFTSADGTVTRTLDTTTERNKPYTIDEKYNHVFTEDNTRTVTVIVNPGTTEEQTHVFTLPVDVGLSIRTQPSMKAYADAACTTPLPKAELDENGNFPLETTIYLLPAEE